MSTPSWGSCGQTLTGRHQPREESLSDLRQAIEVGLNDVRRRRTTDDRDGLAGLRARRVYCPGCEGSPLAPVQIGDSVRCALHPDALGGASLDT